MMRVPFNVLFLCTGNSGRGLMAASLLNRLGKNLFQGYSACALPETQVSPLALASLTEHELPATGLRPKSWDEFDQTGCPPMDFVFAISDRPAAEISSGWNGRPVSASWVIPNPAAVEGTEATIIAAFDKVRAMLTRRIKLFLMLRSPQLIAWL
jgi:protein-tyrosine-phosphatase